MEKRTYNGYFFLIPVDRPGSDYTPRIIPFLKDAAVPLEANHILWYR